MGNKKLYLGTLLADLCHDILAEFPSLVRTPKSAYHYLRFVLILCSFKVRALDSAPGLDALHASHFPSIKLMPGDQGNALEISITEEPIQELSRQFSLPPENVASTSKSFAPRRTSTAFVTSTNNWNSSLAVGTMKKRASTISSGASSGRLCKFIADLYLLEGKTSDASYWYA